MRVLRSFALFLLTIPIPLSVARAGTLTLTLQPAKIEAGKTVTVHMRLARTDNGAPVTLAGLKEVHTKKLHLIIDPSLADYHHEHPQPAGKPGDYEFTFTPHTDGPYRVWADITPTATGRQEYARADLGTVVKPHVVDKTESHEATVDGFHFRLSFDTPPKAGEAVMGAIRVDRGGAAVKTLEPVMGAFAHIVAFGEDYQSVLHVHPMGDEPQNDRARGGPELPFHFEPANSGFSKIFAQVRINGRDIFAPFGVDVK